MTVGKWSSHPNVCLAYHTRVKFVRDGKETFGYVQQRNLNPHRKPGIDRVSYDLWLEIDGKPSGWRIRNIAATKLEVADRSEPVFK